MLRLVNQVDLAGTKTTSFYKTPYLPSDEKSGSHIQPNLGLYKLYKLYKVKLIYKTPYLPSEVWVMSLAMLYRTPTNVER